MLPLSTRVMCSLLVLPPLESNTDGSRGAPPLSELSFQFMRNANSPSLRRGGSGIARDGAERERERGRDVRLVSGREDGSAPGDRVLVGLILCAASADSTRARGEEGMVASGSFSGSLYPVFTIQ